MDEMHTKSVDAGVKELLIMVDIPGGKGNLGHPDTAKRKLAVEVHFPLGGSGPADRAATRFGSMPAPREVAKNRQNSRLTGSGCSAEFAAPHQINVIVENHGGLSSDGAWLAGVIKAR